jgi:hypothetical protein
MWCLGGARRGTSKIKPRANLWFSYSYFLFFTSVGTASFVRKKFIVSLKDKGASKKAKARYHAMGMQCYSTRIEIYRSVLACCCFLNSDFHPSTGLGMRSSAEIP